MRKLKNEELNRLQLDEYKSQKKYPIVVVLDNLRSAHNVGSIFRTCDAFLIEKICLCGISPCPPKKEIRKTALGATESVNWQYFDETMDCIHQLKEENYQIISVEQANKSTSLEDFTIDKSSKMALVFGHEVEGVDERCITGSNHVLEIPQQGTKHSFNVSVSVGIVLWHLTTNRQ